MSIQVFKYSARLLGWLDDETDPECLTDAVLNGWLYEGVVVDAPSVAYEGLKVQSYDHHRGGGPYLCCVGELTGLVYSVDFLFTPYTVRHNKHSQTCAHQWVDHGFKNTWCKHCNANGINELGHVRVA